MNISQSEFFCLILKFCEHTDPRFLFCYLFQGRTFHSDVGTTPKDMPYLSFSTTTPSQTSFPNRTPIHYGSAANWHAPEATPCLLSEVVGCVWEGLAQRSITKSTGYQEAAAMDSADLMPTVFIG